ncbi:MAG TPA: universal stress protein [Acidimicrobiales bacterium]|nr:universal stress protein [Acidimicrobiales bacterium]
MTAPRVTPSRPAVGPLTVDNVLVPLNTSAASEAAIAPAAELASHLGAILHFVTVGVEQVEAEAMARRLDELCEEHPAAVDTRVDWDVPGEIVSVAEELAPAVVCMASHARGRVGEAVLGAYAPDLLAMSTDAVLLVGPDYEPGRHLTDGPVLACVDGSHASELVARVAIRWAVALGLPVRVVTVAEPAPAGLDDRTVHRLHGPDGDPQAYVDALAARWRQPGLDVTGLAVYDPIGPAPGLATLLESTPCGLLAVTTHARTGFRRAVFGSQTASILRHSPVPVLVAPMGQELAHPEAADIVLP